MGHNGTDAYTGKYEKSGRIGRWLVTRFYAAARQLLEPEIGDRYSVLEIGCGPGYSTQRVSAWLDTRDLIAAEPDRALLALARTRNPDTPLVQESVYGLAHPDRAFDCVIMLEVLEHLKDPDAALTQLHRITRRHLLLSTPREPLWRALNIVRGKYIRDLGNTPGHIQHWSTRGLIEKTRRWFHLDGVATPVPWTILLLRPRR